MMQIPQQDSGRVVDVEHDTLRAAAAKLNYDWPLKSDQPGHPLLHSHYSANSAGRIFFTQPNATAASRQ
ncbi:hypothetical protein Amn_11720 [Aminobacter sp. Y103A]|nr:hypothetical protein Amn_11720 [Aminobacter sp. SS-2016]